MIFIALYSNATALHYITFSNNKNGGGGGSLF